jgi:hypothetical protein
MMLTHLFVSAAALRDDTDRKAAICDQERNSQASLRGRLKIAWSFHLKRRNTVR